jgi:hypothetical protein
VEPGGEAGFFQTDKLSTMLRGLEAFQRKEQEKEEKRQKEMTRQVDMYKTLREAGYDPDKAYEAVMKGVSLPKPEAEDRTIPKTQREKILDKIARGVSLTEGEQQVYDETIKHKEKETEDTSLKETINQSKLHARIEQKIADGITLTPGEQKIWEEVIKKSPGKNNNSAQELEDELKSKQDEMVPVYDPLGRKMKVPKSRLTDALKAGWKKRN